METSVGFPDATTFLWSRGWVVAFWWQKQAPLLYQVSYPSLENPFSDQLLLMGQQSSIETRSCPVQIVERIVPFRAAQFYSALTRKSGNERQMQRWWNVFFFSINKPHNQLDLTLLIPAKKQGMTVRRKRKGKKSSLKIVLQFGV